MKKKILKIFIIIIFAFFVYTILLSSKVKQMRNMNFAGKIQTRIEEIIKDDSRFENIRVLVTTADLGSIRIVGKVKNKADLEEFQKILESQNTKDLIIRKTIDIENN